MITRDWETVYLILGDHLFSHLYKEYIIFLRTADESLVQISGTNIFVYLNDRLGRQQQSLIEGKVDNDVMTATETKTKKKPKNIPSHKFNLKNDKDDFTLNIGKGFWEEVVNRNRLFYCAHMNRKNAFF